MQGYACSLGWLSEAWQAQRSLSKQMGAKISVQRHTCGSSCRRTVCWCRWGNRWRDAVQRPGCAILYDEFGSKGVVNHGGPYYRPGLRWPKVFQSAFRLGEDLIISCRFLYRSSRPRCQSPAGADFCPRGRLLGSWDLTAVVTWVRIFPPSLQLFLLLCPSGAVGFFPLPRRFFPYALAVRNADPIW